MPAQVALSTDSVPRNGLRERKKVKTRLAIEDAALGLFEERGYETTTVDEIAARAEISTTTFFRYFPTKADVLLGDHGIQLPAIRQAIVDRPAPESDLVAIWRAIQAEWVVGSQFRAHGAKGPHRCNLGSPHWPELPQWPTMARCPRRSPGSAKWPRAARRTVLTCSKGWTRSLGLGGRVLDRRGLRRPSRRAGRRQLRANERDLPRLVQTRIGRQGALTMMTLKSRDFVPAFGAEVWV